MIRTIRIGVVVGWLGAALASAVAAAAGPQEEAAEMVPIESVPFTQVHIEAGFWKPRLETNRRVTVPYTLEQCERTGRIRNFAVAGGLVEGGFEGIFYNDSDVFKVVEGAAYTLALREDPALEKRLDELIAKIAAAQEDDGYLYTIRTIRGDEIDDRGAGPRRWSNLRSSHELYNVGHLYEAAVAHFQATGKRTLLDVALRNAELIDEVFGHEEGQLDAAPGHQEIEIGLVKLYRVTGDQRWLELSRFFLDRRGRHEGELYGPYSQDHLPVRDQQEAVGHAVRAGYLYSAMADVGALLGDESLIETSRMLWHDVVSKKMYLTGGVGSTRRGEAFGEAYQLPNRTAYAETCAAIAQMLWNHRLFLMSGESRFIDVLERVLYNGFLSGVSLGGDRFFYPNPLACDGRSSFNMGERGRSPWFNCSCCPVNVVRIVPSVPGWVYATQSDAIFANLYASCQTTIDVGDVPVALTQVTDYPWDGAIRVEVEPAEPVQLSLRLRIPGWARGEVLPGELYRYLEPRPPSFELRLNGEEIEAPLENGYAVIERRWERGDRVELDLEMPVRRVLADERVEANRGRTALERGPVVYCFEGIDHAGHVSDLWIADDAPLSAERHPELLGGTVVIDTQAHRMKMEDGEPRSEEVPARAIPYHLWAHREVGEMAVWMAREPVVAEPVPPPPFAARAKPSASHCYSGDTVAALNDGLLPKSSGDHDLPRFTWWSRRGSTEWVQYEFDEPVAIRGVEVYWFDDTGVGACRAPASWRLYRRDGESWEPVEAESFGVELDRFNRVELDPLVTSGLRIEAELREGFSGGILEWRILPDSGQ